VHGLFSLLAVREAFATEEGPADAAGDAVIPGGDAGIDDLGAWSGHRMGVLKVPDVADRIAYSLRIVQIKCMAFS
jgi:hypothetical protein